jgi:hypothetical protein
MTRRVVCVKRERERDSRRENLFLVRSLTAESEKCEMRSNYMLGVRFEMRNWLGNCVGVTLCHHHVCEITFFGLAKTSYLFERLIGIAFSFNMLLAIWNRF